MLRSRRSNGSSTTCGPRSIRTCRRFNGCRSHEIPSAPSRWTTSGCASRISWSCTAIDGGWARLDGETVMVVGQQRGRDTKENLKRNFGMAHPEGYRKALRLMKLAEKFHVPVITFIDTPGAWAGLGAEERGQSEAIARNLFEMSRLEVPIIATVIGEGGSGGALALGVSDRTNMLENAVYSVITVEGCAAILWKDGKSQEMREKAASALRITAQDLLELKVIDEIIDEPAGGAHANHEGTALAVHDVLVRQVEDLRRYKPDKLVRRR